MSGKFIRNIEFNQVFELKEVVKYGEGRVGSKTLVNRKDLSISLFSFDKGEGLSTHSAPGDAMVMILEGLVSIVIGDNPAIVLSGGETAVMPANVPHALEAVERFKMMLIVVKPQTGA